MESNLIIGASIAVISTSLGAILSFLLKTIEENRKRQWELEDKKAGIKQKAAIDRIEQIESLLVDTYSNANLSLEKIANIATIPNKVAAMTTILATLRVKHRLLTNVSYVVNDYDLSSDIKLYTERIESLVKSLSKLTSIEGKSMSITETYVKTLFDEINGLDEPFQIVMKRLETIRCKVISA